MCLSIPKVSTGESAVGSRVSWVELMFRLIGFEELGQTDQFTTSALEFRLKQTGKSSSYTARERHEKDQG